MAKCPRKVKVIVIAAVYLILLRPTQAQSHPLTNDSILQMIQWKATPQEIIGVIDRNIGNELFILSDESIKQLSDAGVTADVFDAMWKAMFKQPVKSQSSTEHPKATQGNTHVDAGANPAATQTDTSGTADQIVAANAPSEDTTQNPTSSSTGSKIPGNAAGAGTDNQTVAQDIDALTKQYKAVKSALTVEDTEDSGFGLVLGIGTLIVRDEDVDYQNQSNVIHSTNLGRATPQLLTGVGFRSKFPGLLRRYRELEPCKSVGQDPSSCGQAWQKRPWTVFVSLKFAPGASQVLNGFVFGTSYAVTRRLDILAGYALTPVNEPAPGFRTTAAQFVTNLQKQGQDLNFNANDMLTNRPNAFDGFPVTDAGGKLIYQGNPLTVHYRNGLVLGISIPLYFKSLF
jgi:hypothetical protein